MKNMLSVGLICFGTLGNICEIDATQLSWPTQEGRLVVLTDTVMFRLPTLSEAARTENRKLAATGFGIHRRPCFIIDDIRQAAGFVNQMNAYVEAEFITQMNASVGESITSPDQKFSAVDLINKILKIYDVEDRSGSDFMYSVYKRFAEAEAGSIAKRVFEKVGKGKRKATYSPNIIELAEWSSAISLLSDPSYHVECGAEEEKKYIEEMAKLFEDFKPVESKTFCSIV